MEIYYRGASTKMHLILVLYNLKIGVICIIMSGADMVG